MAKALVSITLSLLMCLSVIGAVKADPVDVFDPVCSSDSQAQRESAVCKDKQLGGKNPIFGPSGFLTRVISVLSVIVGIAAVIGVMLAGLKFTTSGDNPQEVATARNMLIYAAVGVVVALSAQLIVRFFLYKVGG